MPSGHPASCPQRSARGGQATAVTRHHMVPQLHRQPARHSRPSTQCPHTQIQIQIQIQARKSIPYAILPLFTAPLPTQGGSVGPWPPLSPLTQQPPCRSSRAECRCSYGLQREPRAVPDSASGCPGAAAAPFPPPLPPLSLAQSHAEWLSSAAKRG